MSLADVAPRIEVDPARLRPADHRVGDATRLREATGWQPQILFDRTLRDLLASWRERVRSSPS
jgi:GDPmannose 4,6-dehydratase